MNNHLNNNNKPIVVVTGFGPFGEYIVNASWAAVQKIDKEQIERNHNCELIVLEVPVTYTSVDQIVPELWKTYNPKLVIHTGVSYLAKGLTVEKQAFNNGYELVDYMSYCPDDYTCPINGPSVIQTKLNVESICREINENSLSNNISAVPSDDVGRYLCGYIYYTSLAIDNSRTLFVHVPEIQDSSPEKTARGLEKILDLCLKHINTKIDDCV